MDLLDFEACELDKRAHELILCRSSCGEWETPDARVVEAQDLVFVRPKQCPPVSRPCCSNEEQVGSIDQSLPIPEQLPDVIDERLLVVPAEGRAG